MSKICEVIPSQKGNDKIKVYGYLMVKEKKKNNDKLKFRLKISLEVNSIQNKRKSLIEREKRITIIINDRENRTLMDFLRGIAHNISL